MFDKFQQTICVLHLRAYLAALPTNPPECSHRVWSRNGRERCSDTPRDIIAQLVYCRLWIICYMYTQAHQTPELTKSSHCRKAFRRFSMNFFPSSLLCHIATLDNFCRPNQPVLPSKVLAKKKCKNRVFTWSIQLTKISCMHSRK